MDIRITGKDYMEEMLRLQSRVKELEGINRERLGKIIKSGVEIVELKARVKELETKVEKFENGITYYDKVQELVSRILNMESDLKLNASMLARQCDLAREAEARVSNLLSQHEIASQQIQIWEARVKELEGAIDRHRCSLNADHDKDYVGCRADKELYAHLARLLADNDK